MASAGTMDVNSYARRSAPRGAAHVYEVKLGRRRLVNARTPRALLHCDSRKRSGAGRCGAAGGPIVNIVRTVSP